MANYTDIKSYLKAELKTFRGKQAAADDNKYVAQIAGKGLSTEDFTTALKAKLEGIDTAELTSLKSALETLIDEDENKSARAIAAEEVAKIVAGADTSYDTLKEIADWILSDTTGAAKMASDIAAVKAVSGIVKGDGNGAFSAAVAGTDFVVPVSGKGLSANDLTDELKAKYDAAEANVIETIQLGGTAITPTGKAVNIPLEDFTDADWNEVFA